jgi:hypothetical protein
MWERNRCGRSTIKVESGVVLVKTCDGRSTLVIAANKVVTNTTVTLAVVDMDVPKSVGEGERSRVA